MSKAEDAGQSHGRDGWSSGMVPKERAASRGSAHLIPAATLNQAPDAWEGGMGKRMARKVYVLLTGESHH